jgi:UDP-N-acetylmuramate--alanine ligase
MSSTRYEPPSGSIPTLPVPDLSRCRRVHLVGIGGAGMNGIARLLIARGIQVSGSDLKDSRGLADLRAMGATVFVGHRAEQLGAPDAVVVSTAIPSRNSEIVEARERNLPVYARAQVLAALARGTRTLAVAGTHGKTTTTSMLAVVLAQAGTDPTFVIGGDLNESGSGAASGASDVFVAEADESDGSFLLLRPEVGIVTNVEEDHLDFYRGGKREIVAAFAAFLGRCRSVVVCGDDAGVRASLEIAGLPHERVLRYGMGEGNDVHLTPTSPNGRAARGTLAREGSAGVELVLQVPGVHNLLNATAAVLAAGLVGVPLEVAARGAAAFTGVRRRYERRGEARGATFVDDYAHHPTEVRATLEAARRSEATRIVAVFQPHRYTRTQTLGGEIGRSLASADLVIVTDVYGAGEEPIPGVSGQLVVDALAEASPETRVVYVPRRSELAPFLAQEVGPGDLVLTLGAGDVTMVADETLERMRGGV